MGQVKEDSALTPPNHKWGVGNIVTPQYQGNREVGENIAPQGGEHMLELYLHVDLPKWYHHVSAHRSEGGGGGLYLILFLQYV